MSTSIKNPDILADQQPQLTPQQVEAISLLLTGHSQVDASQRVGVRAETVSRWVHHNPNFVAAYNAARAGQWEAVQNGLGELGHVAMSTLRGLLDDTDPRVRLAAVKLWLTWRQGQVRPTGAVSTGRAAVQLQTDLTPSRDDMLLALASSFATAAKDSG